MKKETIEILVEGGKATGGPPLGPKIGPLGLNINEVVAAINEKTSGFAGMKIPVKVVVDPETKKYEIQVGTPPTSALIKKEIGLDTGTKDGSIVGNLSFDQLLKIANMKKPSLIANDLKGAVKEVIGTCKTLGVTIEGKSAKEMTKEINNGAYEERLT
ncbi:MAG: 50S ribosomal protein L11 [Candidatus Altiarchaeota archaeon]|nr:50S ribosomal protein L11 [Candidatus Altiarchaeota archaeon]